MLDDRSDINRPLERDPYVNRRGRRDASGTGWGIPLAVAALLIAGGFLFYNSVGQGPGRTASNNIPSATSGPVAPGAPAPGPTSTAPAPNR
jgi:hypothetical protein